MATISYDTQSYLLDRANITDAIYRMSLYLDTGNFEGLVEESYAPQVEIDYTSVLGGEPLRAPGEAFVKSREPMARVFDALQHTYTGLVVELPQPGEGRSRPDSCKVSSYCVARMVRRGFEGGDMVSNGGLVYFELIRMKDVEDRGGRNPWRISKQRAVLLWEDGNKELLKPAGDMANK